MTWHLPKLCLRGPLVSVFSALHLPHYIGKYDARRTTDRPVVLEPLRGHGDRTVRPAAGRASAPKRQVYATLLGNWFDVDAERVLGTSFARMPLLSA